MSLLREWLKSDCPNMNHQQLWQRCNVHFPNLPKEF